MMRTVFACLLLVTACVSSPRAVTTSEGSSHALYGMCDVADQCCEVDGDRWCCFDDGKKVRCWKNHEPILGNE